jgi:K+/H+ antiporter YhaU regulatory subunit KhtT
MLAILSLLLVVTLSILITRIATVALTQTGLSREAARFQARSAFTGSGFTTDESEKVVGHPVRRRIILILMLLGNAGIVTAVSSLILTFVGRNESGSVGLRVVLLVTGIVALWALASSSWVDRHLSRVIERALRRYSTIDVSDYASLLHLVGDYRLVEFQVRENGWLAGRKLAECGLRDEGVLALGIKRAKGTYLGAPGGSTSIGAGDTLILYGRDRVLEDLERRRRGASGDRDHEEAVSEQRRVSAEEQQRDEAAETE